MQDQQKKKDSDKRKADTDCLNKEFELSLKERHLLGPKDFFHENKVRVQSMCTGRPLKERLNIPDGVDVF